MPELRGFRERTLSRKPAFGVFVKSTAHQVVEVLGAAGLDFIILDAEHAPIDASVIDRAAPAAAAADLPFLVRVAEGDYRLAAAALDLGASGVVFPHVRSAAAARRAVECVRFEAGLRGVSPSVRAAGYGTLGAAEFAARSDAQVPVWAQIEDSVGLDDLDQIAATPGLDGLFVGRVDLAAALGCRSTDDPRVVEASGRVLEMARNRGIGGMAFSASPTDARAQFDAGASAIVFSSDLGLLKDAASTARREVLESWLDANHQK